MRSHLKLSLILAAAVFPTLGGATVIPTVDLSKGLTKSDLTLNLEQAKIAFKGFGAGKSSDGSMTVLYGMTSDHCLSQYKFTNNPDTGEFTITLPSGSFEICKDFSKLGSDFKSASLISKEGSKLQFSKSVTQVGIRSESSDGRPSKAEEIKADDDSSIGFTSAADIAKKKKADEEAKKQLESVKDELLVKSCTHNLDELDLRVKAIDNLEKVKEFVSRKEVGTKWFKDKRKDNDKRIFEACRLEITRASVNDEGFAECEERLKRLFDADSDTYGPKVKALYLTQISRYISSKSLTVSEAFDKAYKTLDTLRGLGLEDTDAKVADAERAIYMTSLNRAAMEGNLEVYASMAEKLKGFLVDQDVNKCLSDDAKLTQAGSYNPACKDMNAMAVQLMQSEPVANTMARAKADKAARENALLMEQQKLSMCSMYKDAGVATSSECQLLESKAAAEAKAKEAAAQAKVNEGIAPTNGFAKPVEEARNPAATSANEATHPQPPLQQVQAPARPSPVMQVAPAPTGVRVFR